jgi:hypothetical protein
VNVDPVEQRVQDLRALGEPALAQRALDEAMTRAEGGVPFRWQLLYARTLMEQGKLPEAESRLALTLASVSEAADDRRAKPEACLMLGEVMKLQGRVTEAGPQYRRALVLADQAFGRESVEAGAVAVTVARFYVETKQARDAEGAWRRAVVSFERGGDPRAADARRELDLVLASLGKPKSDLVATVSMPAPPPPEPAPATPEGAALLARLPRDRVELLAYVGHAVARDALGGGVPFKLRLEAPPGWIHPTMPVEPDELPLDSWIDGAWRWPAAVAVTLALAAAETAAPAWQKAAPGSPAHDDALAVARRFVATTQPADLEAALELAHGACEEHARHLAPGFKRAGQFSGFASGAFLVEACLRVLAGRRREAFQAASAAAEEATLELAYEPGQKKRTTDRKRAAEESVRAACAAAVTAWALA